MMSSLPEDTVAEIAQLAFAQRRSLTVSMVPVSNLGASMMGVL